MFIGQSKNRRILSKNYWCDNGESYLEKKKNTLNMN